MAIDSPTFESVFRECYPALVQVMHGLTGERSIAEDVAQEAFIRLWEKGPAARPDADHWLYRVARNLALDELKKSRRRAGREAKADPPGSDAPAFEDEDITRVRALVASMRPRDREVLLLRAFNGFSGSEISKVVGRSANAVKQDLFRARERLRQLWLNSGEAR